MWANVGGFNFNLESQWDDITGELPEGTPQTFAKSDGVGALQLSVARYTSGAKPRIVLSDLRECVQGIVQHHRMVNVTESLLGHSSLLAYRADGTLSDAQIAIWCLSDGNNIVVATYTVLQQGEVAIKEMKEVEIMLESMCSAGNKDKK